MSSRTSPNDCLGKSNTVEEKETFPHSEKSVKIELALSGEENEKRKAEIDNG